MKRKKMTPIIFRRLFFVVLTICTMLLLTQLVFAGTSNTIPKYGFLGSVTAYAKVTSQQSAGSTNGYCQMYSYTNPATTINVIGWTWWQCDVLDSGNNIISYHYVGGQASSASSKSDSVSMGGAFSQPGRKLRIRGVHDFNHNGSSPSPWRPYNINVYP
ncbi:MAG: hypothetical protein KDE48_06080 [Anaerolineales bacterium]|nr:hypothetical protein [Anaerolineales bacterium]